VAYYFNFQSYEGLGDVWVLGKREALNLLRPFFSNQHNVLFLHNAKFDMHMLAQEGIELAGTIYDTEVNGRLLYNRRMTYSLGDLAKEIGLEKSGEVDEYIAKHKLYSWMSSPGKAKRSKQPHFDRVPFSIISRYGEQDALVTLKLGVHQLAQLGVEAQRVPNGGLKSLVETESRLVKVCHKMERTGIKIDRAFCTEALAYEQKRAKEAAAEFSDLAGAEFKDSNKELAKAFSKAGEDYPRTAKGNPSFTDDVLEGFTTPLAQLLRTYRDATKRANTYFANFIYFADEHDRIHPNMRQAGTDTGRFSYAEPNLQNCSKDDGSKYPVRGAFIPSPGYFFAMIDYDQQEFRLLLDYAGEMSVIDKILSQGLDVHQATADQMTVTRTEAKTLNFGLLYGMGSEKLSAALGITVSEASELKEKYFEALPMVKKFIRSVTSKADSRGWIFNWAGRVYHFPLLNNPRTGRLDRFAYKAPNHLIQGGCGDIMRRAMLRCDELLLEKYSRMLLTIHDELLFEIRDDEEGIIPSLVTALEESYPSRLLKLTASASIGRKSWAEKEPLGKKSQ